MKTYTIMYRIGKNIRVDETDKFDSLESAFEEGRVRTLNDLLHKDAEVIDDEDCGIEVVGVFES